MPLGGGREKFTSPLNHPAGSVHYSTGFHPCAAHTYDTGQPVHSRAAHATQTATNAPIVHARQCGNSLATRVSALVLPFENPVRKPSVAMKAQYKYSCVACTKVLYRVRNLILFIRQDHYCCCCRIYIYQFFRHFFLWTTQHGAE